MVQKPRVFRVFVSSTFSDMVTERNALHEHVYPRLRALCAKHGARFQAIDLRWGISQEAGLNQSTADVCLNEISRCQRVTKRPNFLLLMGNRYDWQALPDEIPADEWDLLFLRMGKDEQTEMKQWYWRDENAVPAVYVLQAGHDAFVDQTTWYDVETRLRQTLLKALKGLDWSREKRKKYESSLTEQEIEAGIFNYPYAKEGSFCFFRNIENLPSDARAYIDSSQEAQERLANLKHRLNTQLSQNIQCYSAHWTGTGISFDISAFCEAVYQSLAQAIDLEMASFTDVSSLELEHENHKVFMEDYVRHFVGRADALERVSQYIKSDNTKSLVLHGSSDIGKSTIMAKVIQIQPDTIYCFTGISPTTSNIRSLLVNLCEAIKVRYGVENTIPQDYEAVIKVFAAFLELATADKPIIIFCDALDQLSTDNTPSNLCWLPYQFPANVKLILSVIPSPFFEALKRNLPAESFFEVLPMQRSDTDRTRVY